MGRKGEDHPTTLRVIEVLASANYPIPGDEVVRLSKTPSASVASILFGLETKGYVKSRKSPDSRLYTEYWLIEREEEELFQWWLQFQPETRT